MSCRVCIEDNAEYAHTIIYMNLQEDVNVNCTCKNFEVYGLLCCHCLHKLHNHVILKISGKYIIPRSEKSAKKDVWEKVFNDQNDPW